MNIGTVVSSEVAEEEDGDGRVAVLRVVPIQVSKPEPVLPVPVLLERVRWASSNSVAFTILLKLPLFKLAFPLVLVLALTLGLVFLFPEAVTEPATGPEGIVAVIVIVAPCPYVKLSHCWYSASRQFPIAFFDWLVNCPPLTILADPACWSFVIWATVSTICFIN
jgi:hypothetical protein